MAGDPQNGSRWVRQSLKKIKQALFEQKGKRLSCETIRRLLNKEDIRPKSNVKRLHPKPHPDRDRQFKYLISQRDAFLKAGWPCISVDTKKKASSTVFCGMRKNEAKLTENHHEISQYASTKL